MLGVIYRCSNKQHKKQQMLIVNSGATIFYLLLNMSKRAISKTTYIKNICMIFPKILALASLLKYTLVSKCSISSSFPTSPNYIFCFSDKPWDITGLQRMSKSFVSSKSLDWS